MNKKGGKKMEQCEKQAQRHFSGEKMHVFHLVLLQSFLTITKAPALVIKAILSGCIVYLS